MIGPLHKPFLNQPASMARDLVPLAGAADYPAPTLSDQLGICPFPLQPITEPAVYSGHGEPRPRLVRREQRMQFWQNDAVPIDKVACSFAYHGVKMPLDGEQRIFRDPPHETNLQSFAL